MHGPEWVVIVMFLSGGFSSSWFLNLLYSLPAILIALSFHEFAHAWMANKMGDPTAKNLGRLTLDPVKHLDLMGTICIILFSFGWAKPVPINPRNFRKPKRDEILVSLAGVFMNLIVAFIATGVYFALLVSGSTNEILLNIIRPIYIINLYIAIFNLIPIPPLDGFHIISALFIRKAGKVVNILHRYGFIILLVLLISGAVSLLLGYVSNGILTAYSAFFSLFL